MNETHSGNFGSPLTIRPMLGEMVKFTGGTQLDAEAFTLVTDQQELSRIPEIARGKVMVLELDDSNAGLFPSKSQYNKIATLSWNGFVLQLASFPIKDSPIFQKLLRKVRHKLTMISLKLYLYTVKNRLVVVSLK